MGHGIWRALTGLAAVGLLAWLLLLSSEANDRASASTPNPCEIVTEGEVEVILGFPLSEEPEFGEVSGLLFCEWTAVEDEFGHKPEMGVQLFSGPEDEADFLYDETIAPYSEDIEGLGDRAKWTTQVIWNDKMWSELWIRISHYYISIYVNKFDDQFLAHPIETQDEMLQVAHIVLSRLEPRAPVEFTQAVQELLGNYELSSYLVVNGAPPVPIIAGKPTVARVYFDEEDAGEVRTVELSDVASAQDTVTVMPGCTVEMQRLQQDGCESADLYFTPPPGAWKAVITIKDGEGNQLDKMEFPIQSVDTPAFGVSYLPICVALTAGADPTCPSSYVEGPVAGLTGKLFPVAPNEFSYSRLPVPAITLDAPLANDPEEEELLADLRLRWELLSLGSSITAFSGDQLAGWLPDGGASTGTLGIADPIWVGSTGRVSWQIDTSATTPLDAEFTLAHEIGHNLGLRHTNLGDGCGASDSSTDWPYPDSTIQEVGFDVQNKQVKEESKFSVMSYCSPPGSDIWISPHTFKKLAESGLQPQGAHAWPAGATGQYLLVKGTAQADGSSGSIDSAFVIDSATPPAPSNPLGSHCLHLTGGAQVDYCFNLTFTEHRSMAPLEYESFVLRVPFPPGTTTATLARNGTPLASLERTASPPIVQIASPQPGAEWSGEQTIEWSVASDPHAGPLTFAVLYSPDGGANWLPIEIDDTDLVFTFDTRDLAGDEIMVRILASDGLNTTEATVDSITLANGDERIWGDNDCDGDTDAVDGLKTLQDLASLPYSQSEPCPDLGDPVQVTPAGAPAQLWGDVDCDGDLDAADGLSILRSLAGLPVNQQQPCPPIGSPVLVR